MATLYSLTTSPSLHILTCNMIMILPIHSAQFPSLLLFALSALALPPANHATISTNIFTAENSLLNNSLLNNTNNNLICNGRIFGYNLNIASCAEAFSLITAADVNRPLIMGNRGRVTYGLNLPYRWLSCKLFALYLRIHQGFSI